MYQNGDPRWLKLNLSATVPFTPQILYMMFRIALMMRQKYSEALPVLKDIIAKKYGTYKLMDNYGDNFREGSAYEIYRCDWSSDVCSSDLAEDSL